MQRSKINIFHSVHFLIFTYQHVFIENHTGSSEQLDFSQQASNGLASMCYGEYYNSRQKMKIIVVMFLTIIDL